MKKSKLNTSYSVSRGKLDLAKSKPKLGRLNQISNENIMENENAFNLNTQYMDNYDKYNSVILFMRSALMGSYRASRFFSLNFDILLPTWPNLSLVITTKLFEIIN